MLHIGRALVAFTILDLCINLDAAGQQSARTNLMFGGIGDMQLMAFRHADLHIIVLCRNFILNFRRSFHSQACGTTNRTGVHRGNLIIAVCGGFHALCWQLIALAGAQGHGGQGTAQRFRTVSIGIGATGRLSDAAEFGARGVVNLEAHRVNQQVGMLPL